MADNNDRRDSAGRAAHVTAGDSQQGEVSGQQEHPQQAGERVQRSPAPSETTKRDSKTPENVVVAAGISLGVHAPLDSAAPSEHARDRSEHRHEQLSSRDSQQQTIGRSEAASARQTSSPASTSSNDTSPAERDAASPYRAVYHPERNWQPARPGGTVDSDGAPEHGENALGSTLSSLRGFASRARDSVVRVAQGDFTDIRRAGQSIHRVGTGDFSELAGIERYFARVFDECAEFGEKICPCVGPETGRGPRHRAHAGPPPIMMLVDTPGGPYIRLIPDALVEESVRQGLVTAAEVEHQRQEAACTVVTP